MECLKLRSMRLHTMYLSHVCNRPEIALATKNLHGVLCLAAERLELLSARLLIICHTSRKTNHFCSTALFSRDTESAVLILSQDTQERIAQKSLLRQIFLFPDFDFSFSLSLFRSAL